MSKFLLKGERGRGGEWERGRGEEGRREAHGQADRQAGGRGKPAGRQAGGRAGGQAAGWRSRQASGRGRQAAGRGRRGPWAAAPRRSPYGGASLRPPPPAPAGSRGRRAARVGGIPQKCEHPAGDRSSPRLGSPQRRVGRAPATIDDHHASLRPPALAPTGSCGRRAARGARILKKCEHLPRNCLFKRSVSAVEAAGAVAGGHSGQLELVALESNLFSLSVKCPVAALRAGSPKGAEG